MLSRVFFSKYINMWKISVNKKINSANQFAYFEFKYECKIKCKYSKFWYNILCYLEEKSLIQKTVSLMSLFDLALVDFPAGFWNKMQSRQKHGFQVFSSREVQSLS